MVTGGNDGNAVVFNRATNKIAATLSGHSARVNAVAFGSDGTVLSASADRTARVWTRAAQGGAYSEKLRIASHSDELTAIAMHPTQKYALTAARDQKWALHALGAAAAPLVACDAGAALNCGAWHPDGLLVGVGDARGAVSLWDAQSAARAMTLDAHQGSGGVAALAFNENGYLLATAGGANDASVKLWDLRKQVRAASLRAPSRHVLWRSSVCTRCVSRAATSCVRSTLI